MNDYSLQFVFNWLRARTEVAAKVQRMLKLQFRVNFYFEECFQIEDDPLEIDDQYLRRLFYQHLLCDFFYSCVATFTEIVRNLLNLDQLIKTFFQ